jgi:hypothetical protein
MVQDAPRYARQGGPRIFMECYQMTSSDDPVPEIVAAFRRSAMEVSDIDRASAALWECGADEATIRRWLLEVANDAGDILAQERVRRMIAISA